MTNEEIFNKAMEKANNNGWGHENISYEGDMTDKSLGIIFAYSIIFSHDFCKAFWGEEDISWVDREDSHWLSVGSGQDNSYSELYFNGKSWQYHLQQMVLEEDPIKYLETFI